MVQYQLEMVVPTSFSAQRMIDAGRRAPFSAAQYSAMVVSAACLCGAAILTKTYKYFEMGEHSKLPDPDSATVGCSVAAMLRRVEKETQLSTL